MTRARRRRWLLAMTAVTSVAGRARAQTRPRAEGSVTIRGPATSPTRSAVEDGPLAATVIALDRAGRQAASLAPLLDEAPGLHPRSAGDALATTYLSLRGAPSAQVTVAIDGLVLNDAFSPSVDVSQLPPAAFARAEIHRGAAPIRLGLQGLGGVVELRTRALERRSLAWASAGGGSFAQRRASAFVAGTTGTPVPLRGLLTVSYRGSRGDFLFFDDGATPLDPRDDARDRVRANAHGDALDVLGRAGVGPLELTVLGGARWAGLPGPGSLQYLDTYLSQGRWLARVSAPLHRGALRVEPWASAQTRSDRFGDPRGEASSSGARSGGAVLEAGLQALWREEGLSAEAIARARLDRFTTSDGGGGAPGAQAERRSALAGLELDATPHASVRLRGGIALDALEDRSSLRGASVSRVLASPRFAAQWTPRAGLSVRLGASVLERAPSLIEQYGLGEFLRANEELRAESSQTVEGSIIARGTRAGLSGRVELGAFARRATDLIVLTRTSALAMKALNVGSARVVGLEASLRGSIREGVSATVSYAFTHARGTYGLGRDETAVPNIPAHDVFARVEGRWRWLRGSVEISALSGMFFDPANVYAAPARALLGATVGARVPWVRGLSIEASGTNLLDVREGLVQSPGGRSERAAVSDFVGFPLPSRSVYLWASWSTDDR